MPKTEILYETYADLLSRNVPGLSVETISIYYLDTDAGSAESQISDESRTPVRASPKKTRNKTDRLSLIHNWEFRISTLSWEFRDYITRMSVILAEHGGWLTSIELTRAMFNLNLGPTMDCISGRHGTFIEKGILEVNAPLTKAGIAVEPPPGSRAHPNTEISVFNTGCRQSNF